MKLTCWFKRLPLGSLAACISVVWGSVLCVGMLGQSPAAEAVGSNFTGPVTTSVDGTPQRVVDTPMTMEIITADQIRRSGAKDIPGVLRHVGGVDTLEWGNDDVDVSVRGYNEAYAPRLLVLVDGREVEADDFGETLWNALPVELGMIQQIEVIKGPASALYGFRAVRGVINIITKNPLQAEENTASSLGGTQTYGEGSLVASHRFSRPRGGASCGRREPGQRLLDADSDG